MHGFLEMEAIVLASESPRRQALLRQVGIPFRVIVSGVQETHEADPHETVRRNAARKAVAVAGAMAEELPAWIVGADTLVEIDGVSLGKPDDVADARRMLEMLSGRTHRVISGVALVRNAVTPPAVRTCSTDVRFRILDAVDLQFYLGTREWTGVAGAYRIQERGVFLVDWIRGSYSNVVGLPLETFYGMLREGGFRLS